MKPRFLQAWQGWLAGRAGQGVIVVNTAAVGPIETCKPGFLQAWQGWLAGRAVQGVIVVNSAAVGVIGTYNVF